MPKILLADDSTHAQRMGAKILAAEGFEVTTVSNGQAAIHSLEQSVPDLIVADVFMPGRSGYEVCQFVKSDSRLHHIPVLLIIGAMEPYDPEEGKRVGADGLITKPLESSNLVATVQDLLAAAKRFAPSRAKPAKKGAGKEPAEVPQEEVAAAEEPAEWATEAEEISSTGPPKFEIPQEVGQQPVGMFTDLLGDGETSEAPAMATRESPPVEASQPSEPSLQAPPLPSTTIEEQTVWTAEPATITAEEEKLFEQPVGNWGDLTQLVEKSEAEAFSPQRAAVETKPELSQEPSASVAVQEAPVREAPSPAEEIASVTAPSLAGPPPAEETKPELSPAAVDPSAVEQLVRGAVEQLLPEIIERVKQSLKP